MAKVTTGILILRTANSPDWTSDFETQMNNWTTQYITWLQTSPIALEEAAATKSVFITVRWCPFTHHPLQ